MVAKYSREDSLLELKKEFAQLTDCFMKFWTFDEEWYHLFSSGSFGDYVDDLRFASLALLLNADMQIKNKIRNKLKEALYYDEFIDSILSDTYALPNKESLAMSEYVMKFVCVAEQCDCNPLAEYLQVWYHDFKYDPWYNTHGVFGYWGKWAFEAAAVAKKFSLNDERLKTDPFYPYDLAHFIE